jgi:hypothetical protein
MNEAVAVYPERELHVIVDNLRTHKPKQDRRWRQHPQVHLHFTPTHVSWLNQVEVGSSWLGRHCRGASFTNVRQLRDAIDAFIAAYNPRGVSFEWTKREVRSTELQHNYAYLRNQVLGDKYMQLFVFLACCLRASIESSHTTWLLSVSTVIF